MFVVINEVRSLIYRTLQHLALHCIALHNVTPQFLVGQLYDDLQGQIVPSFSFFSILPMKTNACNVGGACIYRMGAW